MNSLALTLPPELMEEIACRAAEIVGERSGRAPRYLTTTEAAEYLRCPASRLYALVSAGRIPHRKDGSRTLFVRDELDGWLSDGGGVRP